MFQIYATDLVIDPVLTFAADTSRRRRDALRGDALRGNTLTLDGRPEARRRRATEDKSSKSLLKALVLMQVFNGNQGSDINSILPLLLIQDQEDNTLLTLIIAMQSGQMNSQTGES